MTATRPNGRRTRRRRVRGQSMVEFALILPVLMIIIGGIIQFGMIFWAQNTLTQVVRDAGRWASTQGACTTPDTVVTATAVNLAQQAQLIGFNGTFTSINVSWRDTPGTPGLTVACPPTDSAVPVWVVITATHQVPVFLPFVPGSGLITSTASFRMEPTP